MITSPIVAVLRFEPPSTLMHCTRRAPELSATSRLVCIWIMPRSPPPRRLPPRAPPPRGGSRRELLCRRGERRMAPPWRRVGRAVDDEPALAFRDRAAFLDPHGVAGPVAVVGVVRRIFFRARHELLVQRVHDPALDAHDHRLITGVADHDSLQNAFRHPLTLPATPGRAAR